MVTLFQLFWKRLKEFSPKIKKRKKKEKKERKKEKKIKLVIVSSNKRE